MARGSNRKGEQLRLPFPIMSGKDEIAFTAGSFPVLKKYDTWSNQTSCPARGYHVSL